MRPQRTIALGAAALGLAVLGAGGSYALWNATDTQAGGVITSGNLAIELVGDTTWELVCAPSPTPETIDSATFLAVPGDQIIITQDFQTLLEGDNIAGRVTVDWSAAPSLPAGVSATYVVDGGALTTPTSPTPLGTSVTVPVSPANLAEGTDATWTVTVTLDYDGSKADRVVLPGDLAAEPTEFSDLGTIELTLDQVRDGTGFTS